MRGSKAKALRKIARVVTVRLPMVKYKRGPVSIVLDKCTRHYYHTLLKPCHREFQFRTINGFKRLILIGTKA